MSLFRRSIACIFVSREEKAGGGDEERGEVGEVTLEEGGGIGFFVAGGETGDGGLVEECKVSLACSFPSRPLVATPITTILTTVRAESHPSHGKREEAEEDLTFFSAFSENSSPSKRGRFWLGDDPLDWSIGGRWVDEKETDILAIYLSFLFIKFNLNPESPIKGIFQEAKLYR
jgi:hypothetical protein